MSKVFVGGLSWDTTDDSLRTAFEPFGTLLSANIISDRETGRSRGFGFVMFEDEENAAKAIKEMTDTTLDGRVIRCDMASDKGRGERGGERGGRRDFGGRREGGRRDYDRSDRGDRGGDRGGDRRGGGYERRDDRRDDRRDQDRGGDDRRERRSHKPRDDE